MVRKPVVAGLFYPGGKDELTKEVSAFIQPGKEQKVKGLISPHAGYVYSGSCAGKTYGRIEVPDKVIILGVNHDFRGLGNRMAVDGHDAWNTPLGNIEVDKDLRMRLVSKSSVFQEDTVSGQREHSLEVQVPFIQYKNPKARILPIAVASHHWDELFAGGKEIARLIQEEKGDILMVSSTDMSHYIDVKSAKRQDQKAIDRIISLDPKGLYSTVLNEDISMCGVAPTVMMLIAAVELGATVSEVVEYTHSGIASGDFDRVVAYLGMIIY